MTLTYIRPDADDADGRWVNEVGSQTNLFASIDETSASDADYIISSSVTAGDVDTVRVRLSDPGSVSEPAAVRFRYKKTGADKMTLTVVLMEGSTEIARWDEFDVDDAAYVTTTETLTTPQFNAISDFTNLYLKFLAQYQWWLDDASIDLDFTTSRYYDSSDPTVAVTDFLSCSRASVGYAKNADGTLTSFGTTLRITDLGLLVEDARTNQLLYSQQFTTGSPALWSAMATGGVMTNNAGVAPDGTTTAASLTPGSSSGTAWGTFHDVTIGPAGANSFSVYFEKLGTSYNYAFINFLDFTAGSWSYAAIIDLTTGTITATNTVGSPTGVFSSGELLGNGWVRATVGMTGFGATDVNRIYFGIADAAVPASWDSGNNIPYFAAGTPDSSSGIYAWGAQVEEGSFPSSYIPTSSAATTRAADLISLIGNADTIVHGTTGSIVADATIYDDPSLIGNARILSEQSGHSPLFVNLNTTVDAYLYISDGNMSATLGNGRTWTMGVKAGATWINAGNASLCGGGGSVTTSTDGTTPSAGTVYVGSKSDMYFIYNYIRRLTFWNSAISDATL